MCVCFCSLCKVIVLSASTRNSASGTLIPYSRSRWERVWLASAARARGLVFSAPKLAGTTDRAPKARDLPRVNSELAASNRNGSRSGSVVGRIDRRMHEVTESPYQRSHAKNHTCCECDCSTE